MYKIWADWNPFFANFPVIFVTTMCRNDEFSSMMSLLPDSELFILFAENSQILLKIYVIPILLTFMYSRVQKST